MGKQVNNQKYGIQVPIAVDDYIWVTQGSSAFDREPVLYDTKEAAKQAAVIWGPLAKVKKYDKDH